MTGHDRVIDVAVVDDHPIIRDGISAWLSEPGSSIRVVGTAATVDALLAGRAATPTWCCSISTSETGQLRSVMSS